MSLELLVVTFYHIRCIDAASDLLGKVIEGKHVGIGLQRIDDFWILPVPLCVEGNNGNINFLKMGNLKFPNLGGLIFLFL